MALPHLELAAGNGRLNGAVQSLVQVHMEGGWQVEALLDRLGAEVEQVHEDAHVLVTDGGLHAAVVALRVDGGLEELVSGPGLEDDGQAARGRGRSCGCKSGLDCRIDYMHGLGVRALHHRPVDDHPELLADAGSVRDGQRRRRHADAHWRDRQVAFRDLDCRYGRIGYGRLVGWVTVVGVGEVVGQQYPLASAVYRDELNRDGRHFDRQVAIGVHDD